jgi:hypothetical protein
MKDYLVSSRWLAVSAAAASICARAAVEPFATFGSANHLFHRIGQIWTCEKVPKPQGQRCSQDLHCEKFGNFDVFPRVFASGRNGHLM